MWDAGIEEFFAFRDKTVPFIKCPCLYLCIERHFLVSAILRIVHQCGKNCTANPCLTLRLLHRHATDMPIGKQAPCADRIAIGIKCEGMRAYRVELVPFKFQRNLLFMHENFQPQRLRKLPLLLPGADRNMPGRRLVGHLPAFYQYVSDTIFQRACSFAQYCRLRIECLLLPTRVSWVKVATIISSRAG